MFIRYSKLASLCQYLGAFWIVCKMIDSSYGNHMKVLWMCLAEREITLDDWLYVYPIRE